MDNIKYFENRNQWREWLEKNFESEKIVWFVFPKVSTNKPRVSYNDAVEEALCFSWIDSTVKSYDDESHIQKFTPRKNFGYYSQSNKERIKWLYEHNMIHPKVIDSIKHIIDEEYTFPDDIVSEIKKDEVVWDNYNKLSDSYKRIRIEYINNARESEEEFKKRLNNFIGKTRQVKMIKGHGGIDKYY